MRLKQQHFWCDNFNSHLDFLFETYKNKLNGFNRIAVLRNVLKG